MFRLFAAILGIFLLLVGIVGILTPIPFGLLFLIAAFLLLIPASPMAASGLKGLRRRSVYFDGLMHRASRRLPFVYRRILRRTELGDAERGPYRG